MNDDEMLATMRRSLTGVTDSLTDVRLDQSVNKIQARARGRRLRRGLAGASTGGLALGLGLGLALAAGGPAGGGSAPSARPVHVNLDAWSVNTQSSGRVYVDVRQLQDPVLLRQTLADAGVPAIVTFGEFCSGTSGGDGADLRQVIGKTAVNGEARLTINPAGIPNGSRLSIGIVPAWKRGVRGFDAGFALVKNGEHLACGLPDNNAAGQGKKGPAPAGNGTSVPGTVKTGFGS